MRRASAAIASLLPFAVALGNACGGESSSTAAGGLRQACYGNGTCDDGLTCVSEVCVMVPEGGLGGSSGSASSSGSSGSSGGRSSSGGSASGSGSSGGTQDAAAMDATSGTADSSAGDSAGAVGDAVVDVGSEALGTPDSGSPDSPAAADALPDSPKDATADTAADATTDATTDTGSSEGGGDPEIDYGTLPVTLTTTEMDVSPGTETFVCQTFANPWGRQVDVKTYSLQMDNAAVDMYAFYQTNATNGAATACPSGGLTFGPFTFAAVTPQADLDYPPTVGATIASTTGFNIVVHYLNTGSTVAHGTASLTMRVAKTGVVTNRAGAIFLNQATISVSPTSCTTAHGGCPSTSTYTLPQAVNVLQSESVASQFTQLFTAGTGSAPAALDQTTAWLHPVPTVFAPALNLPAGTMVSWTCTDTNDTGATLTFGEHALTNAMCISLSFIYPISDYTSPVIGTQY